MSGACVVTWFSGCGTIRGAGSKRRRLDVEDRGEAAKPFARTSCRRVSCGAAAAAAAAATGSSVGSPSKKRAIAIYTILARSSVVSMLLISTYLHIPLTPL
jgi:hypothetical protein